MFANLRFHRRRERIYTWLIALVGIGLAIAAALFARDHALRVAGEGFGREVAARASALDVSLAQRLQMVRSLKAFVATRATINQADFRAFVEAMSAGSSGMQSMQWMPLIKGDTRAVFERQAMADFPQFKIREMVAPLAVVDAAQYETYAPVRLIEPVAGNESMVGLDLLSSQWYADAMVYAERTGKIVATERFLLLQEETAGPGMQYAVMLLAAVPDATGALRGYVAGVFRVGDLLRSAMAGLPAVGLHISVTDATNPGDEQALYVFSDGLSELNDLLSVPVEVKAGMAEGLFAARDIQVADRTWRIYFEPGPGYFAPLPPIPAWVAAVLLLLITGLLTSLFLLMQKRAQLLARASLSDGLTGLANRAFCDRMLAAEWERATRYDKPLSIVMIDIDQFADYNAKLGPLAGDDCLRRIAGALAHIPGRSSDLVCRYTGDRFVIILPETVAGGAWQVAGRVLDVVRALALVHPGHVPEPVLTVSLVVATACPERGDLLSAFMDDVAEPLDSSERRLTGNLVIGLPGTPS